MSRRLALAVLVLLLPGTAAAQWVASIGEDASIPRAGTLRLGISVRFEEYDRRFAPSGDGSIEPLGADFSNLELTGLPSGAVTQGHVRALTGVQDLALTLGDLDVRMRGTVDRLPLTAELGILRRIALAATIPIVRTRTTVIVGPNIGTDATAGLNPATTLAGALASNTSLSNALAAANRDLRDLLQQCQGSADPECSAVNANRAEAESFVASSELFKHHFDAVYLQSRYVPVLSSPADQIIVARLSGMRDQFESYGIGSLTGAPVRPVGAAPIAYEALQSFITDPAHGISADPLVSIERYSLGDIELGAKALLIDRIDPAGNRPLGARLLAGGLVRLATAQRELSRNLVDIGTGDGQTDLEALAILDAVVGRHLALTASMRYTRQLEDEVLIRVPDSPGQVLIPAAQEISVQRDLGDVFTFEAVPRVSLLHEFFAVAGYYSMRRKGSDSYGFNVPDLPNALDGSALAAGTKVTEHRIGFGAAFSNLAAYRRGRARFPYEISYLHTRSRSSSGGVVPYSTEDRLQLKVYAPIWGR